MTAPGQSEQLAVAGNQQVGPAAEREDQEFLIVSVATARQPIRVTILIPGRLAEAHEAAVALDQRLLRRTIERKLRVGRNTFQFVQALPVAEAVQRAVVDGGAQ